MIATLLLLAAAAPPPDVTAVGIVVSPQPQRCVAVLRSGARTRIVGPGETAFGGRVVAIAPGVVSLDFGGQRVDLRLALGGAAPPPPATAALSAKARPEDPENPARSMARREVERRLAEELPRILSETALTLVAESDGRVKGLALTRLPQGTLLSEAGLRAGDVITRLNDVPIDGLGTLVGLWPSLQGESEIKAVVLRDGRPVSLTVTLR